MRLLENTIGLELADDNKTLDIILIHNGKESQQQQRYTKSDIRALAHCLLGISEAMK